MSQDTRSLPRWFWCKIRQRKTQSIVWDKVNGCWRIWIFCWEIERARNGSKGKSQSCYISAVVSSGTKWKICVSKTIGPSRDPTFKQMGRHTRMSMHNLQQVLLHHSHLEPSSPDRWRDANEVLETIIGWASCIQWSGAMLSSACCEWQDGEDDTFERVCWKAAEWEEG